MITRKCNAAWIRAGIFFQENLKYLKYLKYILLHFLLIYFIILIISATVKSQHEFHTKYCFIKI